MRVRGVVELPFGLVRQMSRLLELSRKDSICVEQAKTSLCWRIDPPFWRLRGMVFHFCSKYGKRRI